MTQSAHIQNASIVPADAGAEEFYEGHPGHVWQLCCEESERNQRRRELALLTSESNALKALLAMHAKPAPRQSQTADATPVVGGGNSLSGKILWLLENNGPLTRREIGDRLQLSGIRDCIYQLTKQGRVTVHGRGNAAVVTFVSREVVA